jgi:hypothetical protein
MVNLPARIPKAAKRASRWKSQTHRNHVRGFSCSVCGRASGIEVAHVRIGSGAGIGQKPDDWRTVSLCMDCHRRQHEVGEETFWNDRDIEALIRAFIQASPKRHEIEQIMRDRANG